MKLDLLEAKLTCRKQRTLPWPLPPAWKTGSREGNQKKKGLVPILDIASDAALLVAFILEYLIYTNKLVMLKNQEQAKELP
jgi:hypothetical protein